MKDILTKASWILTALASINIGLRPLQFDFFRLGFIQDNFAPLIGPIYYLIGLAGVYSLFLFFTEDK